MRKREPGETPRERGTAAAKPGFLYLVATPIGNLEDITLRALRVLKEARRVACEDTRRTQKLLQHYGIEARLVSYHEHNEHSRTPELLALLERGEDVALVSDAGTPLISDPGYRLTTECIGRGIRVIPIPGPSSVMAALAAAGLPCEEFLFAGFLPARRGPRRKALERLRAEPRTIAFYEAPHRLADTLEDAATILGDRRAVVARELTKVYEEFARGTIRELAARFAANPARGEITLLIGPAPAEAPLPSSSNPGASVSPPAELLQDRVEQLIRAQGLDRKAALKQAARELGLSRRDAYKLLHT
jgi:16S rRNA (cytidine1402-2'-O)-methyltransferase